MNEKVFLLTNFIPPYRVSLYWALWRRLRNFKILISTPMEPNRPWLPQLIDLPIILQRSVTLKERQRHPSGFTEEAYIHIPYDTLLLLFGERPEVVISGEFGLRTLQSAVYRTLNPRSRLLVWATLSDRTEQGRGLLRRILRRWILRRADGILVNGEAGARYIRTLGYPEERIFWVPYTTDVMAFANCPLSRSSEEAYRLIYVGQLIERKGVEPFLRTLVEWAEKHLERRVEFWIVGDGPLRGVLSQLGKPQNMTTHLLGAKSYSELPGIYAQCGILAFPTLADEWGLIVNEAMAAGLPILGSVYSQAVEELVEEGVNGWVFRPDVAQEMYAAVDRALNTPQEELAEMRERARKRALDLTPDVVADRIVATIQKVLVR